MQTLMTAANYWGIPGAGDCDCFTIAYAACMQEINIPQKIVLAGRKANEYTHIYNLVRYYGEWYPADLTNAEFGTERPYLYHKEIKI